MYLFVDIGGTNTRLAVSRDAKTFSEPVVFATEKAFDEAVFTMEKKINELGLEENIDETIVGLPGVTDKNNNSLCVSPNLPNWVGRLIKESLEGITSSPVDIYNDSDLAGLGEAVFGAGKGYDVVVYLTISTGVGGSRVVNGKLDKMTYGLEPGFLIVDAGGNLCEECPVPATLEDLVGGANVERRAGCHPKDINNADFWDRIALWLSYGLNNVIALWSPDIIVLGGPMMRDIPIEKVREYTRDTVKFLPELPVIEPATYEKDKAFYGAMALVGQL